MFEVAGLNQVFEDADIFGLQNIDSEHAIGVVTDNQAVEWEWHR